MIPLVLSLLLASPAQLAKVPATPRPNYARAACVDVAGERVAVAWEDGRVTLHEAESGEERIRLDPALKSVPWASAFSPDGERLVVLGHDGRMALWELDGRTATPPLEALPADETSTPYPFGASIHWSPNGKLLAVIDWRGPSSLWSASGELLQRWTRPDATGDPQLEWLSDSSAFLTVEGQHVVPRDGRSGVPLEGAEGLHPLDCGDPIVALALHSGGELIVTGHDDGRWRTWQLPSGERIREDRFEDPFVHDPEDEVAALAFSPDGTLLALSTREGSHVIVQRLSTGERVWVSEFQGAHFFEVLQIAWSPDGSRLWFAFECRGGLLHSVVPDMRARPREHGKGGVPCFGDGLGVTLSGGAVRALAPDGRELWTHPRPWPR